MYIYIYIYIYSREYVFSERLSEFQQSLTGRKQGTELLRVLASSAVLLFHRALHPQYEYAQYLLQVTVTKLKYATINANGSALILPITRL